MNSYYTISTETWRILLPGDWGEIEAQAEGCHYFESSDGQRGFYIACWQADPEPHDYSNAKALEPVYALEKSAFASMAGYQWQVMAEELHSGKQFESALVDFYAKKQLYRIVCKSIASLPWIVRTSLHDYRCENWARSRERFRDIIDSITIQPVSA